MFESTFLKYLSIYDGVIREAITESDIELASAVFEDQVELVPNESVNTSTGNTKTVNMDQLKSMMQRYLQAGNRFELLEVHLLKQSKNQKNSNDLDMENSDDDVSSSPPDDGTIRIQYSTRTIKANADSEIRTARVILSTCGRIKSILDTPLKSDEAKPINNDESSEENHCRGAINSPEFHLFGFGSSKANSSILLTPVFRSL